MARSEQMRRSQSSIIPSVVGWVVVCGALQAFAQAPVAPASDADQPGPIRERRLIQRLEQARQLLAPRDPNEKADESQAMRLLQSLLDEGTSAEEAAETDDVFLETPAGERRVVEQSLKREARRLLGEMSAQGRQAYEVLIGKVARVQLEAALAAVDWLEIEEVARRFFHTSAGYEATITLGLRELDLGEPVAAAARFQEVHDWPHARAAREPADRQQDGRAGMVSTTRQVGVAYRIFVELLAGILVGAGLGWFLDRIFGTAPWLLLGFLLLVTFVPQISLWLPRLLFGG